MQKINKKHFWFEKLSGGEILLCLKDLIFRDALVSYNREKITKPAMIFLNFLQRTELRGKFAASHLMLLGRDARGMTLRYQVNSDLNSCTEGFIDKYIPQASIRYRNMLKSYMARHIEPKMIFVTQVISEIEAENKPAVRNMIYIRKNHLSYIIRDFYSSRGLAIREQFSLSEFLCFFLRPFFFLFALYLAGIINVKIKEKFSVIRPAVWIEYYPSFLHLFWLGKIRSSDFDTVAYVDRQDTPLTSDLIKEFERTKIKWVDAHFVVLLNQSRLKWLQKIRLCKEAFLVFFTRPVWLGIFRFEHSFLLQIYKSVFFRFKVKVLIQHQESSWKQGIQAEAIESVGGIMIGYHWGCYQYYLIPANIFAHHVYFVWGKMMYDVLQKKGHACRYILPAGIYMIKDDHRASDNIPLQNAKFIILIFDDIVTDYGYLSTRSLSEFYLKLLNIVKINPDFGCIIKSKQSHLEGLYLLPSEREIRALIDELTQERRLVFLEIDVLPSTVARFAHLSVNYSINSAGVIAAISNETPSIHWDCAGLSKHPFWKDSQQKLIFNTLDDIEDAILKANRQDKSIGDFSAWKKYISYFNDQLGAQRMGGFVNTYMRESIKTKDPQWSLDFAVKKYMQENKVGNDFLVMESRWGDEE